MKRGSRFPPEEDGSGADRLEHLAAMRHKMGRWIGRVILWAIGLGVVALLVLYLSRQE